VPTPMEPVTAQRVPKQTGVTMLNDPPMMPPAQGEMWPDIPLPPGVVRNPDGTLSRPSGPVPQKVEEIEKVIDPVGEVPEMTVPSGFHVELPGGVITPDGTLHTDAWVRELTGYDEERLAVLDPVENVGRYLTELLMLGVERIDGVDKKDHRDTFRRMLIGDREALALAIRRATYGDTLEGLLLTCHLETGGCGKQSELTIDLTEDTPVEKLENPLERQFHVELRNGRSALVAFIDGRSQEAFAQDITKKTVTEVNSIMLAHSVVSLDGEPVAGNLSRVRKMPAGDRRIIQNFVGKKTFGPHLSDIKVDCATCHKEHLITLGIGDLFRF